MKKIGVYAWFGGNVSIDDRFRAIKEVGFDSVALYWGDEYPEITDENDKTIKKVQDIYKLEVENFHAPYNTASDLFKDDDIKGEAVIDRYIKCVKDAAKYHVETVVIHLTGDYNDPVINEKGIIRLKRLIDCAKEYNVKLAFENLVASGLPYLHRVLEVYKDECVGFCYDLGHDNIHCENKFEILKRYKDRLFALHIHGNDGKGDYHRRVIDGNIDIEKFKNILSEIEFSCPISLEVIQNLDLNTYDQFKEYVELLKQDCLMLIK